MLSLQLKDGEYLTIGEDIVIQVFTTSAIRMSVQGAANSARRGTGAQREGAARVPARRTEEERRKGEQFYGFFQLTSWLKYSSPCCFPVSPAGNWSAAPHPNAPEYWM